MGIEILISFLLAALISFVGSLQPGLVNLSVLYSGYHHSRRAAMKVAIGSIIPDVLYTTVALYLYAISSDVLFFKTMLHYFFVPLLLGFGMYLFSKKESANREETAKRPNFMRGVFIGLVNPFIIPFWLLWINQIIDRNLLSLATTESQAAFVMGSAVGAFALLMCVVFLTARYKDQMESMAKGSINRALGIICFILAGVEMIRLLLP